MAPVRTLSLYAVFQFVSGSAAYSPTKSCQIRLHALAPDTADRGLKETRECPWADAVYRRVAADERVPTGTDCGRPNEMPTPDNGSGHFGKLAMSSRNRLLSGLALIVFVGVAAVGVIRFTREPHAVLSRRALHPYQYPWRR